MLSGLCLGLRCVLDAGQEDRQRKNEKTLGFYSNDTIHGNVHCRKDKIRYEIIVAILSYSSLLCIILYAILEGYVRVLDGGMVDGQYDNIIKNQ